MSRPSFIIKGRITANFKSSGNTPVRIEVFTISAEIEAKTSRQPLTTLVGIRSIEQSLEGIFLD